MRNLPFPLLPGVLVIMPAAARPSACPLDGRDYEVVFGSVNGDICQSAEVMCSASGCRTADDWGVMEGGRSGCVVCKSAREAAHIMI